MSADIYRTFYSIFDAQYCIQDEYLISYTDPSNGDIGGTVVVKHRSLERGNNWLSFNSCPEYIDWENIYNDVNSTHTTTSYEAIPNTYSVQNHEEIWTNISGINKIYSFQYNYLLNKTTFDYLMDKCMPTIIGTPEITQDITDLAEFYNGSVTAQTVKYPLFVPPNLFTLPTGPATATTYASTPIGFGINFSGYPISPGYVVPVDILSNLPDGFSTPLEIMLTILGMRLFNARFLSTRFNELAYRLSIDGIGPETPIYGINTSAVSLDSNNTILGYDYYPDDPILTKDYNFAVFEALHPTYVPFTWNKASGFTNYQDYWQSWDTFAMNISGAIPYAAVENGLLRYARGYLSDNTLLQYSQDLQYVPNIDDRNVITDILTTAENTNCSIMQLINRIWFDTYADMLYNFDTNKINTNYSIGQAFAGTSGIQHIIDTIYGVADLYRDAMFSGVPPTTSYYTGTENNMPSRPYIFDMALNLRNTLLNFPLFGNLNHLVLENNIKPRENSFMLSYGADPNNQNWKKGIVTGIPTNNPYGSSYLGPPYLVSQWIDGDTPEIPPYIPLRQGIINPYKQSENEQNSVNIITIPYFSGNPYFVLRDDALGINQFHEALI